MTDKDNFLIRFWKFLKSDSWASFVVTLLLAFIFIKFIFFPGLALVTGSELPLVIVESCSMYHHEGGFEKIFFSDVYRDNGVSIHDTETWPFQNGFSKGDVMFVVGAEDIEVGDVIIFNAGAQYPLIHRVVSINDDGTVGTKGDNWKTNNAQLGVEKAIRQDQIIGKAILKTPAIGWLKLIFFEGNRPASQRGFCG